MSDQFRVAFNEDKVILEAIEINEQSPGAKKPIKLAIDASPIQMRRMIEKKIEAEQSKTNATAA